jgi:hypothetical protein
MIDLQGGCMKLQETKYDFATYSEWTTTNKYNMINTIIILL